MTRNIIEMITVFVMTVALTTMMAIIVAINSNTVSNNS